MQDNQVFIFGAGGNGAGHLKSLKPGVRLAGFLDNDPAKQGSTFCGHPVYSCDDLPRLGPGNIYIASTFCLEITSQLLRNPNLASCTVVDYTLKALFEMEKKAGEKKRAIITGNSYAFYGLDDACLDEHVVNLSLNGQDIQTDYLLLQRAVQAAAPGSVRFVLITLYHYIFDYETCKRENMETEYIYSFLKDPSLSAEAYSSVFTEDLGRNIKESYGLMLTPEMIRSAPHEAKIRSERLYPASRKRTVAVLEEMTRYVLKQGIQPVFVVFPMHGAYIRGLDPEHMRFFNATVNAVAREYDVPLLDGLEYPLPDRAFGDSSHVNGIGSTLFSLEIRRVLETLRLPT